MKRLIVLGLFHGFNLGDPIILMGCTHRNRTMVQFCTNGPHTPVKVLNNLQKVLTFKYNTDDISWKNPREGQYSAFILR